MCRAAFLVAVDARATALDATRALRPRSSSAVIDAAYGSGAVRSCEKTPYRFVLGATISNGRGRGRPEWNVESDAVLLWRRQRSCAAVLRHGLASPASAPSGAGRRNRHATVAAWPRLCPLRIASASMSTTAWP